MQIKDNGKAALNAAYSKGQEAFNTVEQNTRGFWNNPSNPYAKNSLTYKMFNLGFDHAFNGYSKC